ncbi:MAG: lipid-A-disaccharide synthase-related protein [Gemmobacter sp.]
MILYLSNGHGEDEIGGRIHDALGLPAQAWAMVGEGNAWRRRGVPLIGPPNLLPSEGFATLSLRHFLRDLRHGFLPTYARQVRFARALSGFRLLVAVGDVVPLAAGLLSRLPTAFVSTAKSAWYGGRTGRGTGHDRLDHALMRRAVAVFPRDALTAARLAAAGVPCADRGNPMMDALAPRDPAALCPPGETAVVLLPGSRGDAADNARLLLEAAARLPGIRALVAATAALTPARAIPPDWTPAAWDAPLPGAAHVALRHRGGARALIVTDRFADCLHAARLAIGMAGTANEQAVGLGLPLIAVPGQGNQGPAFTAVKARYFGPAAVTAPRDPDMIAAAAARLLADPEARARMAAAGRARMGPPGAAAAIAADLRALAA